MSSIVSPNVGIGTTRVCKHTSQFHYCLLPNSILLLALPSLTESKPCAHGARNIRPQPFISAHSLQPSMLIIAFEFAHLFYASKYVHRDCLPNIGRGRSYSLDRTVAGKKEEDTSTSQHTDQSHKSRKDFSRYVLRSKNERLSGHIRRNDKEMPWLETQRESD